MTAVPIVRSFQPTRSLIASVFLGALLLHAPSLWMGFFFDDHVHQLVLDGTVHVEHMRPWNLFDFGYASDWQDVDGLLGNFPWWTSPDFSIRFLRPLTSLSLRIDHTLYGGDAVGYHVTNLLLYFFALVAVHRLYLTLGLGRWTAIGALALFSTSNGGWLAISWPANRSTLLVLIASALAVSVLERRERLGRGLALAAALACGLLACASKESGVAAFAVIGLRLLLIRRNAGDEATKRWAAGGMAAAITLALAYLLLFLGLGYGPNSMLYAPPWTDPVGYLSNLGILLTAGALELLAPVSIDTTPMLTGSMSVSVVLGTLFALPLLAYVTRAVGRERAVFFVGWTLLFTIPQASGAPADRALLVRPSAPPLCSRCSLPASGSSIAWQPLA